MSRLYIIIQKLNYAQTNSSVFDINTIQISDELIYALYYIPRDRIIDYFRVIMHLKGTNESEWDADIFKKTEILKYIISAIKQNLTDKLANKIINKYDDTYNKFNNLIETILYIIKSLPFDAILLNEYLDPEYIKTNLEMKNILLNFIAYFKVIYKSKLNSSSSSSSSNQNIDFMPDILTSEKSIRILSSLFSLMDNIYANKLQRFIEDICKKIISESTKQNDYDIYDDSDSNEDSDGRDLSLNSDSEPDYDSERESDSDTTLSAYNKIIYEKLDKLILLYNSALNKLDRKQKQYAELYNQGKAMMCILYMFKSRYALKTLPLNILYPTSLFDGITNDRIENYKKIPELSKFAEFFSGQKIYELDFLSIPDYVMLIQMDKADSEKYMCNIISKANELYSKNIIYTKINMLSIKFRQLLRKVAKIDSLEYQNLSNLSILFEQLEHN